MCVCDGTAVLIKHERDTASYQLTDPLDDTTNQLSAYAVFFFFVFCLHLVNITIANPSHLWIDRWMRLHH